MSFHLDITISGMCMLVRDTDAAPRMLHVLMPPTGAHAHRARLAYRREYEFPGSDPKRMERRVLAGRQLNLLDLSASNGFSLTLPPNVFDFGQAPLGPRKVDRAFLDGEPLPTGLRSRVRLRAGQYHEHRPGGFFFVRNPNGSETSHRMATSISWRLENVSREGKPLENLVLKLGDDEHTLFPLPGPDGQPVIHLMVLHVTPTELDVIGPTWPPHVKCPPNRHRVVHFSHYFPLVGLPPASPIPEFDEDRTKAAGVCPDLYAITEVELDRESFDDEGARGSLQPTTSSELFAGSELTCMVTAAPGGG